MSCCCAATKRPALRPNRRPPEFSLRWSLGLALLVVLAAAPAAAATPLAAAAYRRDLQGWEASLAAVRSPAEATVLGARVPDAWHVATSGGVVTVPADWLRRGLLQAGEGLVPLARGLPPLRARLQWLAAEAAPASAPDYAAARRRLGGILARREFAAVHGPTSADRMRDAIAAMFAALMEWLGHVRGGGSGRWLGPLLLLVGCALLGWGIATLSSRRAPRSAPTCVSPEPILSWQRWLGQAREAGARGAWAEVVQAAYRAGVAWGAEQEWWQADPARTPREYLHLLAAAHPAQAHWHGLVTGLEAASYAGRPATSAAGREMLRNLELLGCH